MIEVTAKEGNPQQEGWWRRLYDFVQESDSEIQLGNFDAWMHDMAQEENHSKFFDFAQANGISIADDKTWFLDQAKKKLGETIPYTQGDQNPLYNLFDEEVYSGLGITHDVQKLSDKDYRNLSINYAELSYGLTEAKDRFEGLKDQLPKELQDYSYEWLNPPKEEGDEFGVSLMSPDEMRKVGKGHLVQEHYGVSDEQKKASEEYWKQRGPEGYDDAELEKELEANVKQGTKNAAVKTIQQKYHMFGSRIEQVSNYLNNSEEHFQEIVSKAQADQDLSEDEIEFVKHVQSALMEYYSLDDALTAYSNIDKEYKKQDQDWLNTYASVYRFKYNSSEEGTPDWLLKLQFGVEGTIIGKAARTIGVVTGLSESLKEYEQINPMMAQELGKSYMLDEVMIPTLQIAADMAVAKRASKGVKWSANKMNVKPMANNLVGKIGTIKTPKGLQKFRRVTKEGAERVQRESVRLSKLGVDPKQATRLAVERDPAMSSILGRAQRIDGIKTETLDFAMFDLLGELSNQMVESAHNKSWDFDGGRLGSSVFWGGNKGVWYR